MTDEVSICNRALAMIGSRSTISSINPSDGSNEANQCALWYYSTRDALLRAAHWNFTRTQIQLTQLKASTDVNSTCPAPWAFEYAYPSNCMKMRFIAPYLPPNVQPGSIPLTTGTQGPAINGVNYWNRPVRFLVANDLDVNNNDSTVILTNEPMATGIFTKQITNPQLFDSNFVKALEASLAAFLIPSINMNMTLLKLQISLAESYITQARVSDGNEGPIINNIEPEWIRIRGGLGLFSYGVFGYGWDGMSWPGVF